MKTIRYLLRLFFSVPNLITFLVWWVVARDLFAHPANPHLPRFMLVVGSVGAVFLSAIILSFWIAGVMTLHGNPKARRWLEFWVR